jgi:hypothetical protein
MMTRCNKCRKKGIPIKCNYCINSYCTACIQIEIHGCDGKHLQIKKSIDNLKKQLAFSKDTILNI